VGIIDNIEREQLRADIPQFKPAIRSRCTSGSSRARASACRSTGICIKRQGAGVRETFSVRKQSFGVGVERTFRCIHRRSRRSR